MNHELLWVLGLLAIVITLFVINRPRMDVVALLVILALPLLGILTVEQALAGFSDPNVVLIAALFVIGEGLVRTGIAYRIGEWMSERAGNSEGRLLVLLMVAVAGLGSKMGIDATNKWPAEAGRQWGTPIAMDEAVKQRVDDLWRDLGL